MFLKVFLFAIILNCVVLASCEESSQEETHLMPDTNTESETELKAEENVDLSTSDNEDIKTEITVPLIGSESPTTTTNSVASDLSTETSLNASEDDAGEIGDMTIGTTSATDSADIEGETGTVEAIETSELNVTESTEGDTGEPIVNVTENVTDQATVDTTEENATEGTDDTVTKEASVESTVEVVTETPTPPTTTTTSTTTTTELPTTTIDPLYPQIPEADIDPKYRNETFEDFMRKNPSAKIFKSPGFPAPYAENLNCTLSVTLTNCTGVDIVVHYLDLNPILRDSLNIRGGEEDATNESGIKLTGRQFGYALKIIHTTSLYIWFNSGSFTEEYQGFLLTYSPYGNDTLPPTTTEAPVTIPPSEVQVFEVQLVVPESSKTIETWNKFKEVLASSASQYVNDQNLIYQLAHFDNVTVDIYPCSSNWPNYENCIRLQFSISLWSLDYDPDVDLSIFDYELSTNSLSIMWDMYGRDEFLQVLKVEEYYIPDGTYILLLWTGVSLTIIVIFIGVLYSIWRIDIFREYRRMHGKSDDQQDILKNKSEMDLSMYPIPHQPYPTLFETNEMNTGGYYDSYEMNSVSFQGHNFQEKPSNNYRHANNHFSPNIIDFNDTQLFPDDEEDFGRVQSLSPRSKHKFLLVGAKRDESNT